jgi:hypothetical protein
VGCSDGDGDGDGDGEGDGGSRSNGHSVRQARHGFCLAESLGI